MSRIAATRAATAVLAVVLGATAWVLFGPAQLGGATRYAIVAGSSMEPELHHGDLAVVRSGGDLERGVVALYDDPELGVSVLHRIVRVSGGRYVLKGDNNDFLDETRPTRREIAGSLWFAVPYAGSSLAWAREPLHAALFVFFLAVFALGGGVEATWTRPTRSGTR